MAYQATSKPNLMFRVVDTPRPTREECKREADKTFGPGNYTIERVRDSAPKSRAA